MRNLLFFFFLDVVDYFPLSGFAIFPPTLINKQTERKKRNEGTIPQKKGTPVSHSVDPPVSSHTRLRAHTQPRLSIRSGPLRYPDGSGRCVTKATLIRPGRRAEPWALTEVVSNLTTCRPLLIVPVGAPGIDPGPLTGAVVVAPDDGMRTGA